MTGGQHITRQHVVSKVVLTRYAVDGIVEIEDVRKPGRWRPKSPSVVGYVEDYVRHDSAGAEAVWQRTETLLATALNELDGGVVPERGSRTEQTVKDCLALHWARSHSFKAAADKAWERVRRASIEDLARLPELLARGLQIHPLVRELAAEHIPVAVTCRVLGFTTQAFYKWQGSR
jgi:hypothetical protein